MSLTKVTYSMIENGVFDVTNYGAAGNGLADDTQAIKDAIAAVPAEGGVVYFPSGTYRVTSQILIDSKPFVDFVGNGYSSVIKPDDGAYIVMLFNGSGSNVIQGISFDSGNYVNPLLTMVKMTAATAYSTIRDCAFSGADVGLFLGETYIVKVVDNQFSNCDTALYATNAEGSVADLLISGNTFGTTYIGTDPVVYLAYNGVRVVNNYFETETKSKISLRVATNSQFTVVSNNDFTTSGGVYIEANNRVTFSSNTVLNSWYSGFDQAFLRISGSANAIVTGNVFFNSSIPSGISCFSISGSATIVGNFINGWVNGIGVSVAGGSVIGNVVANCTTGIRSESTANAFIIGNNITNNTTDLLAGGTTPSMAFNAANTITNSSSAGTRFGNTPATFSDLNNMAVVEFRANTTAATPGTIADGDGVTVTGFAPFGTDLGDVVMPSYDKDLQGVTLTAYMSSAGNVAYRFQNETGGSVTLAAGNLNAFIRKTA